MADLNEQQSSLSFKLTGADTGGTETNYVDATVNGLKVDGSAVTQPVSAASLPLPTGAATETTLSTLNGKVNNLGSAINTADIINVSGTQGTFSVTTTASPIRVGGSNLANRKLVTFYHDTSNTVYWGYTSGVTTSTGTPLNRGQMTQWPVGPSVDIYLISTTTVAGRITEGA
jgi:hypothetical protein